MMPTVTSRSNFSPVKPSKSTDCPVFGKTPSPARRAVLTAIIVPAVLMPNGESVDVSWTNAYLVGAVVAAVISWTSKNLLLTIVVGMAVFFAWQWLVG